MVSVDHTPSLSLSDESCILSVESSWVVKLGVSVPGGKSLV